MAEVKVLAVEEDGSKMQMSEESPGGSPPVGPPAGRPPPAPYLPGGYGYSPTPKTNGLAVASLVFGILSLVMCPLSGIVGLLTGFKARADILRSRGTESGQGLALGGIITSSIGLVVVGGVVLAIVAVSVLGRAASSKFSSVGAAVANGGVSSAPSSTAAVTTTTLLVSATGKPCVAVSDPLPRGAPAVPVQIGPPPTTLVKQDLKVGTGAQVAAGDTVTVNYIGVACSTGKIFDSSYSRGQTATFGLNQVIEGWTDGIPGMKVGGQRLLGIPADLAYGSNPPPGIAPDETLWFVVELTAVQSP